MPAELAVIPAIMKAWAIFKEKLTKEQSFLSCGKRSALFVKLRIFVPNFQGTTKEVCLKVSNKEAHAPYSHFGLRWTTDLDYFRSDGYTSALKMRFYSQKCQAALNKQSNKWALSVIKGCTQTFAHRHVLPQKPHLCSLVYFWADRGAGQTDGRSTEQAWAVWSQPEMRLPSLQMLVMGHSHATRVDDKLESYVSLEQLSGLCMQTWPEGSSIGCKPGLLMMIWQVALFLSCQH